MAEEPSNAAKPASAASAASPAKRQPPSKFLKKARMAVLSGVVGIALGALVGFTVARPSFAPDAFLSAGMGLLALASGHVIARAYHYWRVPRDIERWSVEYEEMGFETIRAGIHFAQCQMALADMIERCPRPFEDIVMLTSEIGYAMHREALLHAEQAGIIPSICWHEKRAIYGAPAATLTCDGVVEPEASPQVIDAVSVSIPPPPSVRLVPRLLPAQSSVTGVSSVTSGARGRYTMRAGKLVALAKDTGPKES